MSNRFKTPPGLRVSSTNLNHHLWNNHGTWFLHYTTYPTPFTKERVRRSLATKDVFIARTRRDSLFAELAGRTVAKTDNRRRAFAA